MEQAHHQPNSQYLGVTGTNTPVASLSATSGTDVGNGIVLSADGSIQSLRNNTLTLGGGTTGNISLAENTSVTGNLSATGTITANTTGTINGININSGAISNATYNGLTVTNNGTNTLNIAAGKTLTASNSLTLAGTDSTTMTFPTTSATIARTDAAQTFSGTQTFSGSIDTLFTGNNAVVYGTTSTGVLASAVTSTSGQCLLSGAGAGYVPYWDTCPGGSSGGGAFTINATDGATYQLNTTTDLILGGTSSASAKFAFLNMAAPTQSNPPTFRVYDQNSTNYIDLYHDGTNAYLQTNTGDIVIGSGAGGVNIEDAIANESAINNGALVFGDKILTQATENTGTALAVFDNLGTGDIFTASSSGVTVFSLNINGGIELAGGYGSTGQCLTANGTSAATWGTCGGGGAFSISDANGTTYQHNTTTDLLIGGTSTSSAKFAVLNVAGTNTPVASISATSGTDATKGLYISGDGSIQTVRNNTLTLGGGTTGNISLADNTSVTGNLSATGTITANTTGTINGININSGAISNATYNGLTVTNNGTNTLNIAAGKTLTASNTITLAGTDSTTMTFPTTSATIARTDAAQTFTGTQTFSGTIAANGAGGITSTQGTLVINAAGNLDIQDALNADSITSDAGVSIAAGQSYTGTGAVTLSSGGTNQNLTLNSSGTGTIGIGTDGDAETLNLGTGTAAKTITIGNGNDDTFSLNSSGVDISSGGAISNATYNGLTVTANGTNTLNIAAGKTLAVSNSLTLAGTDSTTMTFPTTSATIARTDAAQTFSGVQTFSGSIDTLFTGNNAVVYGTTSTGVLASAVTSTSGQCLLSGAGAGYVPYWDTCPGGSSGGGAFTINTTDGTTIQNITTTDLILGGTATASSKFAFIMNSTEASPRLGNPEFRIYDSGNTNYLTLYNDGSNSYLQSNTGDIVIGSGAGGVNIEDAIANESAINNGWLAIGDKLLVQKSESAGTALAVFDNLGTGDILTASASGVTRLTLNNDGDLLPGTDDAQDLGSTSLRWQDLYLGPASIHIGSAASDESILTYNTGSNQFELDYNGDTTADYIFGSTNGLDVNSNIITNIGSTGTDFDTAGGLTLTTDAVGTVLNLNNSTNASSIFVANDNGTPVFTIADGGVITATQNINADGGLDVDNAFVVANGGKVSTIDISDAQIELTGANTTFNQTTGDITLTAAGGDILLANTNTISIGGATQGRAYNSISDTTATNHGLASDNDLYIEGELEVDGTIYADTSVIAGGTTYSNGSITDTDSNADNLFDFTLAATDNSFRVLTGNLRVGNGTPTQTQNGEDAYIEGTLEVDGTSYFEGSIDTLFTGNNAVVYGTPSTGVLTSATTSSDGLCLMSNNPGNTPSWQTCPGSGLGQTPWTQDIDADGYDLTDLSNIQFRTTTGAPAGTIVSAYSDNTGDLNLNALTGKQIHLQVAGTDVVNISSTGLSTTGSLTAATTGTLNGISVNSGAISSVTTLSASSTITFSGLTASRAIFIDGSQQLTTSATSSVLANSITDEEGSGALVFATSPTLLLQT